MSDHIETKTGGHASQDYCSGDFAPHIQNYKLLFRIGEGSYGTVWLAEGVTGVRRAVKIVSRSRFDSDRPFDREFDGIRRYEPISRSHPALLHVLHVGRNEPEGYFYYVMELADGLEDVADGVTESYTPHSLRVDLRKRGRLPLRECINIGVDLASALAHLHGQGLIHRDVKPSNIVFVGGRPKLADIGLVSMVSEARSYVGTEGYIPPDGPGSPGADVFSLGKVLYEISTGKDRLDFPELPSALNQASDRRLMLGLNTIILTACDSRPAKRYESAEEMLRSLVALRDHGKVRPRPRRILRPVLIAAVAGVMLSVLASVLFFPSHQRDRGVAKTETSSPMPHGANVVLDADEVRIVYRDSSRNIWVCDATGARHKKLTVEGHFANPRWALDGSRILYHARDGREIWTMKPNGSEPGRACSWVGSEPLGDTAWISSGHFVTAYDTATPDMFVLLHGNISSGELKEVYRPADRNEPQWGFSLDFSPVLGKIALSSCERNSTPQSDVYLLDPVNWDLTVVWEDPGNSLQDGGPRCSWLTPRIAWNHSLSSGTTPNAYVVAIKDLRIPEAPPSFICDEYANVCLQDWTGEDHLLVLVVSGMTPELCVFNHSGDRIGMIEMPNPLLEARWRKGFALHGLVRSSLRSSEQSGLATP